MSISESNHEQTGIKRSSEESQDSRWEGNAGVQLWLKELRTYIDFPALQDPASYNLEQVIQQISEMRTGHD